ncbi:polysaccharide deacetylase family protein [Clostridium sp. AM58-1XD]|uniref:polysaccharide deacetylase family protein n=1 Tax=Clostridium sp. AM58-1XD TaxID=2292307 RepID=UPI000E483B45|nr:polysaccharide deacetylase family protein [Clostridium sp. AM58-1XD]RGY99208.1 polysaccharide deacetylase family protein [Clostridium sp. AM58-1XD]
MKRFSFHCFSENALFWMALILLTAGAAVTFYEQGRLAMSVSSFHILSAPTAGNHRYKDRELPIYCVSTKKPKVALSFDAAWGNEDTRQIMDILSKHGVKATFFMTGGWVEKYPEDVKYIASQGHDLGNHSENHKNMSQLDGDAIRSEITSTHEKVKALTGQEMSLFRPPYGDYDNDVISISKELGYYPIEWDVDSLDWKDYGSQSIIDTVVNHSHLAGGSIILMHNGAKYTPQALEDVITGLQKKGYELVPISQLIYRDNYHLDHEGRQIPDVPEETTAERTK